MFSKIENVFKESTTLKEFIKGVRACKTISEELAFINREKAEIRLSLTKDQNDQEIFTKMCKLIYMNINGYDTDFGQLKCLKLITSDQFEYKKIGYLALTQLFNEKSEVLLLATNRLSIDLQSENQYSVPLALSALSEIGTADMCRDLSNIIITLINDESILVKKKSLLVACRVVRKVPELTQDYIEPCVRVLNEKNHGILLGGLALAQHIMNQNKSYKQYFKKNVGHLIKCLKSLNGSINTEYEVSGVTDPFLQVEILKFFRIVAHKDNQLRDEISDILAQIAYNAQSSKNVNNITISSIESAQSLRTLGINVLGKFLKLKDNNSKQTLQVQNHDKTIFKVINCKQIIKIINHQQLFIFKYIFLRKIQFQENNPILIIIIIYTLFK